MLAALILAAGLRLGMQFLGPDVFWHQVAFFFLVWWLVFLLARLALSRYWSFWLAITAVGYLALRFWELDNRLATFAWLGGMGVLAKTLRSLDSS